MQSADIGDGAVGSAEIGDGEITAEDMGNLDLSRFTVPDPGGPGMGFSRSGNWSHTLSANAPIEAPAFRSLGAIHARSIHP